MEEKLISVRNLKKYFKVSAGTLKAVDDISFDIYKGETLGLVGESGCGKSTCGRTVLRLYQPTAGEILLNGENICDFNRKKMMETRKDMQMIFQDPYASLDPRMTVEDIVAEPLDIHNVCENKKERHDRVIELLQLVGLGSEHATRFPHEFSGGQRQRVGIARALALKPRFIVCDEPISALDVSIQAQVVNLLKKLQDDLSLTYLFIAHDLSMVRYISSRVGVMYLGKMVEISTSDEIYDNPIHPYTKGLISAIPVPDPKLQRERKRISLDGEIPSPINVGNYCRLKDRCMFADERCRNEEPQMEEVKPGHFCACHKAGEFV